MAVPWKTQRERLEGAVEEWVARAALSSSLVCGVNHCGHRRYQLPRGIHRGCLLILKEIWRAFWWSRWIIGVLALLILADLLIHSIRKKNLATRDHEADRQERERRRQEREERARRDREALVGLLTCSTVLMVVQLQAIPPERRTFHLQYHHIKAKVCRPFAR